VETHDDGNRRRGGGDPAASRRRLIGRTPVAGDPRHADRVGHCARGRVLRVEHAGELVGGGVGGGLHDRLRDPVDRLRRARAVVHPDGGGCVRPDQPRIRDGQRRPARADRVDRLLHGDVHRGRRRLRNAGRGRRAAAPRTRFPGAGGGYRRNHRPHHRRHVRRGGDADRGRYPESDGERRVHPHRDPRRRDERSGVLRQRGGVGGDVSRAGRVRDAAVRGRHGRLLLR